MSDNTGWLFFPYMAAVEIFQTHLENKNISKSLQLSIPFLPTPSKTFLNQLPLTSCVPQNFCLSIFTEPYCHPPSLLPFITNFLKMWSTSGRSCIPSLWILNFLFLIFYWSFLKACWHPSSLLKDSTPSPSVPPPSSLDIYFLIGSGRSLFTCFTGSLSLFSCKPWGDVSPGLHPWSFLHAL